MKKSFVAAAGALTAVVLALGPGATAEPGGGAKAVKTTVKLDGELRGSGPQYFFKGTIDSKNPACVKGRKVVLSAEAIPFTYGSDKADKDGKFKIFVNGGDPAPPDGQLTATAPKTKVGKVRCAKGVDTAMLSGPARPWGPAQH